MNAAARPAPWSQLEREAPELATAIRARFEANPHHVLGTVRPTGAPRLSGTEVVFKEGELTVGMMSGSRKLADVRRDPRVELHSAPLEADLAAGDAKLAGMLVETHASAGEAGAFFALAITTASLVAVQQDALQFRIWQPGRGVRERSRS